MDGGDDQHRPHDVGQDMPAQDGEGTNADEAGCLHVFLVAFHQRGTAHGAGVLHPAGDADGEDQHVQRQLVVHVARQEAPRHAVDQQRYQDGRERQLHVGDAHDEAVHAAAGVAADKAQRHAQHHREQH